MTFATNTTPLIAKAALVSRVAHRAVGQKRKYSKQPYEVHPHRVYGILIEHASYLTEYMAAAAYLHDVVEDTEIELDYLRLEFGGPVTDLVEELTNIRHKGSREERKRLDRERLATVSNDAKIIKMADMIDNIEDVPEEGKVFAETYFPEQRLLYAALEGADPAIENVLNRLLLSKGY